MLELLRKSLSNAPVSGKKILWLFPDPLSTFHGRKTELKELKKLVSGPYPITFIYGTAAVGKTELCIKFLHDCWKSSNGNCSAIYFDFENEETLTRDLKHVSSSVFGSSYMKNDMQQIISDLFEFLITNQRNCYFLYDNCNDRKLLQKMFPKNPSNSLIDFPKILITSQVTDLDISIKNRLYVPEFKQDDAKQFAMCCFKQSTFQQAEQAREKFSYDYPCHPLAIVVAASITKQFTPNKISFWDQLETLETAQVVSGRKEKNLERQYPTALTSAWDKALNVLAHCKEGEEALNFLYLVAFIGYDTKAKKFLLKFFPAETIRKYEQMLSNLNLFGNNGVSKIVRLVLKKRVVRSKLEISILRKILEQLGKCSEVDKQIYRDTWKYACKHRCLVRKYFYAQTLDGSLLNPLQCFVDYDDHKSVACLLAHFMSPWSDFGNIFSFSCGLKPCPELRIKATQTEILNEINMLRVKMTRTGGYIRVSFEKSWYIRYSFVVVDIFLIIVALIASFTS